MILHPDFLDHRKTQKLIRLTNDPASPLILIRLWAYCQRQKQCVFPALPNLHDICHSELPSDQLQAILIECGFLEKTEQGYAVHDWERVNRMLVSAWANGQRGGNPSQFREKRHPTGSRQATSRLPTGLGNKSDKIRAGYRPAGTENASTSESPLSPSSEGLPKEEEKPDPDAAKKLGSLLKQTSAALRSDPPENTESKKL